MPVAVQAFDAGDKLQYSCDLKRGQEGMCNWDKGMSQVWHLAGLLDRAKGRAVEDLLYRYASFVLCGVFSPYTLSEMTFVNI